MAIHFTLHGDHNSYPGTAFFLESAVTGYRWKPQVNQSPYLAQTYDHPLISLLALRMTMLQDRL